LKGFAKSIAEKYIRTPETTDNAVLYLPTEGLFAEVARRPNLIEFLQRQHRVVIAGSTAFSAVLTSIQLAFKTLAIQQQGDEVWRLLGATKAEFGKFGEIIAKVSKKITEAGNHLEQVGVRSRAIERTLKGVEELEYDVKPALTLIENEIDDEAESDHE
jgi:DNA recombination protein RmuC